jgi:hypothetical protein
MCRIVVDASKFCLILGFPPLLFIIDSYVNSDVLSHVRKDIRNLKKVTLVRLFLEVCNVSIHIFKNLQDISSMLTMLQFQYQVLHMVKLKGICPRKNQRIKLKKIQT